MPEIISVLFWLFSSRPQENCRVQSIDNVLADSLIGSHSADADNSASVLLPIPSENRFIRTVDLDSVSMRVEGVVVLLLCSDNSEEKLNFGRV